MAYMENLFYSLHSEFSIILYYFGKNQLQSYSISSFLNNAFSEVRPINIRINKMFVNVELSNLFNFFSPSSNHSLHYHSPGKLNSITPKNKELVQNEGEKDTYQTPVVPEAFIKFQFITSIFVKG